MLKSESKSVLDPRCSRLSTDDTVSETLCAHIIGLSTSLTNWRWTQEE